jgi:DNA-binding transcriptional LysR family regulator
MTRVGLFDDEYRVVVSDRHEFAGRESVPFKDLEDQPWVDYDLWSGPTSRVVDLACAAAGFERRNFAASEDDHAALALVSSDLAITVLPRRDAQLPPGRRRGPHRPEPAARSAVCAPPAVFCQGRPALLPGETRRSS